MNIEKSLFWHQGLFIQPQHFQLADRHMASLLAPVYEYALPNFWGVGNMEIQKASLGARTFCITSGAFMFPDGTFVSLPGNAVAESRHFDDAWIEGGK